MPALAEERLTVLLRRIEADLALGRASDLVAELRGLTAQHPLQERLWTALIRAPNQSGRRAEALTAYETVRRLLAEELGVDPGDELRRLHLAMLAEPEPARARPDRLVPRQLPPDVRGFTGRADDLARLDGQLAEELRGPVSGKRCYDGAMAPLGTHGVPEGHSVIVIVRTTVSHADRT